MSWLYKAKVQAYWLICFKGFRDWRIWAPLSIMCCPIVMGSPGGLWSPKLGIGLGDLYFFFFLPLLNLCSVARFLRRGWESVYRERKRGEENGAWRTWWGMRIPRRYACVLRWLRVVKFEGIWRTYGGTLGLLGWDLKSWELWSIGAFLDSGAGAGLDNFWKSRLRVRRLKNY